MCDKELLEMSAKAAGIKFEWRKGPVFYGPYDMYGVRQSKIVELSWLLSGRGEWNPLKNDGDAFRLANQLQISVCYSNGHHDVRAGRPAFDICRLGELDDIRREIVIAAAEIGRSML